MSRRFVIGMTGASGALLAVELIRAWKLYEPDVILELVLSSVAGETLELETHYTISDLVEMVDQVYDNKHMGAAIASGSYLCDGMIILPCSMKTLAAIACGYADTLIARAADVALKEGRMLILSPRETPFNAIHLENMLKLSRMGVKMVPFIPSFYHQPETLEDVVDHYIMRLLDQLSVPKNIRGRWC